MMVDSLMFTPDSAIADQALGGNADTAKVSDASISGSANPVISSTHHNLKLSGNESSPTGFKDGYSLLSPEAIEFGD